MSAHPSRRRGVLARVDFPRPARRRGSGGCVRRTTLADDRAEVFAVEISSGTPAVGFGNHGPVVAPLAGDRRWHAVVTLGIARRAQRQARGAPTLAEDQDGRDFDLFAAD